MVPICEPRGNTAVCSQVLGQLRFNRHDALKCKVVQLHKDMIDGVQVTIEQGDGYGPHGRMDLMVSIPPAGNVRPIDLVSQRRLKIQHYLQHLQIQILLRQLVKL